MTAFVRVVPDEVEQHGPAAAIVLAHIRFRCASDGPGRFERDGYRWWRVSHQDLGEEVGLSRKAVMAALQVLGEAVAAKQFPPLANRSRAYRIRDDADALTSQSPNQDHADQPLSESGLPESESGLSIVPIGTLHSPESDNALPIENLEKEGEAAGSRLAAAPALSSEQSANGKPTFHPRCREHLHDPEPPRCPGCRDARIAAEEQAVAEQARADRERAATVEAIDNCPHCDKYGRLDDLTDCPGHPNLRQLRAVS